MGTKGKVFIGIAVVGVVGAAVVMNLKGSRVPTTEVEVEKVKTRRLVSIVEASGQIEPSVSVDISSDVIGRITAIGPEEGDRVQKGDFLVQIDPTQLEQRKAQFEAALDSAVARRGQSLANLEQAKLEYDRKKNLWDKELIPEAEFDAARVALDVREADLNAAEYSIQQARASLEEAKDSLGKCRLVAPMSGIVIRKNAEVGETAISGTLNNAGSLLMTIADLSSMETEVEVDETDVVNTRLGQEAEVELDAFPDQTFRGVVTEIANSSVLGASQVGQPQQSATYKVTVRLIEMPDSIRPGLSATARITTEVRENALSVPIQSLVIREVKKDEKAEEAAAKPEGSASGEGVALASTNEETGAGEENAGPSEPEAEAKPADAAGEPEAENDDEENASKNEKEGIFVVRDGKAVFVPVEVGIAGEKHFEIKGNVQEGDTVVSGPFSALRKLKDGDVLKVKNKNDKEKGQDGSSTSQ